MTEYSGIFELRKRLDTMRQPRWREPFNKLADLLARDEHPYGPQRPIRVTEDDDYKKCSAWLPAKLGSECEYCYRLTSVGGLTCSTGSLQLQSEQSESYNTERILRHVTAEQPWVKLSRIATGELKGRRGFTWWTPLQLFDGETYLNAYRIGLSNDYIPDNIVILRCRTEFLIKNSLLTVPSILNAFDLLIFQATQEDRSPSSGITIDLKDSPTLQTGVPEFVSRPIPVGQIECRLIGGTKQTNGNRKIMEEDLISVLRLYYDRELSNGFGAVGQGA